MAIETHDDAYAWIDALQPGGTTAVDNAELGQVLRLLCEDWQTVAARTAQHDARLDAIEAQLTALKAMLEALQAAEDDLDIFRAGYERGYAQGFTHAQGAKEDDDG